MCCSHLCWLLYLQFHCQTQLFLWLMAHQPKKYLIILIFNSRTNKTKYTYKYFRLQVSNFLFFYVTFT